MIIYLYKEKSHWLIISDNLEYFDDNIFVIIYCKLLRVALS
jgi:hypothetical protein